MKIKFFLPRFPPALLLLWVNVSMRFSRSSGNAYSPAVVFYGVRKIIINR